MARQLNWDAIPDKVNLEAGNYRMKIVSIKELEPLGEQAPQLTYLCTFEVDEPVEHRGEMHFERFRIGDENDPMAEDENTWRRSMGAKNMKKMLKEAQCVLLDTDEATYEAAKGQVLIVKIVKTMGKAGTQNEGQEFSNSRGYFSINSPEALSVGKVVASPGMVSGSAANVGTQEMTCPTCQEKVKRAEFGKHINLHRQEKAA
jgi:hypothetical protein